MNAERASEPLKLDTSRPPFRLHSSVQHYAWGDNTFIPGLLGMANNDQRPFAELWMGAHPELPSKVDVGGRLVPLNEMITRSPEAMLGETVASRFDRRLPYLFKVLSAAEPLSIQAHPSKRHAERGFQRENELGIPIGAPHRNYRDDNHKPELIVALTDFYGLRGFRPLDQIASELNRNPEFNSLAAEFEPTSDSLSSLYGRFMRLTQAEVDRILDPLIVRLQKENAVNPFQRDVREYWVLRSDRVYSNGGHRDRGLFSVYLLNLVHLQVGEAMYLPAGILHAYLQGSGIEIMANSNNVLRGGLTPKHVDVDELLDNVTFAGDEPEILRPVPATCQRDLVYSTPASEFELHRIDFKASEVYANSEAHSAEILFVIAENPATTLNLSSGEAKMTLARGAAAFVPAGGSYNVASTGSATLYRATVPLADSELPTPISSFRGRTPTALAFGTSGLRGLVEDITDLEAYINTRGFLAYLSDAGEIQPGEVVTIGGDLRPSTDSPNRSIMRAVARAIEEAGLEVENVGRLPTPALTFHALTRRQASVMITGSHIPFDRNGIKFNKKTGEVLKEDEAGILAAVARIRRHEYSRPEPTSLFQDDGMFKPGESRELPDVSESARLNYLARYRDFFAGSPLAGKRVVFYQHSAVGRDMFVDLLESLGAEVIPAGRSDQFIAIDTEDITPDRLADLQSMADDAIGQQGRIDAILSTDGDSDRPLLAGVDADGKVRFCGGDLLGIIVADYLGADAVSVPISCNDAVDLQLAKRNVKPTKTRIGSPFVIKSMQQSAASQESIVVGWEANGGFLLGSTINRAGVELAPLPTRDAALPLIAALLAATEKGVTLVDLFSSLPPRFSKAGLIDQFPQETSQRIVKSFSPTDASIQDVYFDKESVRAERAARESESVQSAEATSLLEARAAVQSVFGKTCGFTDVIRLNFIDGIRIYFSNGEIAHIRPSGNAPQLRIYAVADSQSRAEEMVQFSLAEPDGILRQLEKVVANGADGFPTS